MKTIFLFSFLLICGCLSAQYAHSGKYIYTVPDKVVRMKYNAKRAIVPAVLSFVSGAAWGLHEVTAHHWPEFSRKFPKASPKFWNPALSWQNKYVNWPEDKRRTAVPVFFTDSKHLLASTNQVFAFGAGVSIAIGERRPWWHYVADAGISFGAYTIGNAITYDLLYR